ncbi:MAG: hypothetical protein ACRDZ4_23450 [Egibacteraceae bacterium]
MGVVDDMVWEVPPVCPVGLLLERLDMLKMEEPNEWARVVETGSVETARAVVDILNAVLDKKIDVTAWEFSWSIGSGGAGRIYAKHLK